MYYAGDLPELGWVALHGIPSSCTMYYPEDNDTWTEEARNGIHSTWAPWLPNKVSNSNKDIIERVAEYTSDDLYAQYADVVKSGAPYEVMFKRHQELFRNYGITDVREGIKYLSNTSDKRWAYLALTTDDFYVAHNFKDWLDNTGGGKVTKGFLLADNLIFNSEINQWLSFTTYLESDYPGVSKYRTMLYDFMDATSDSIEIVSTVKLVSDLSSKATGIAKVESENLIKQLNKCKTIEEVDTLIEQYTKKGLFAELSSKRGENDEVLFDYTLDESSGFGLFAKSMGYATKTVNVFNFGINELRDIITFDSKLAICFQYRRFLEDIVKDTDNLPFQLRWAASLILDEMNDQYLGLIKDVAVDILKQTNINPTIRTMVLEKIGANSLSSWLTVIDIDSFIINKIYGDIGSMAKNESYVEAYAILSHAFEKKLEESKRAFQEHPTEVNAWNFYYNYNILYKLRYKGEQACLEMTHVKGLLACISDFGYEYKKNCVNETLDMLMNKCQFTMDEATPIPESCQFATKSVIKCPVNVDVYTSDGVLVAQLIEGVESDVINEYGRFAVVRDVYSNDYSKVICFYNDDNYMIKTTGADDGLVSMDLAQAKDDPEKVTTYTFNNIPVNRNSVIEASIEQITDENSYNIDYDGDNVVDAVGEVTTKNADDAYVIPEEISISDDSIELSENETALLRVTVAPANTSDQTVSWKSNDPKIATVVDGKVSAESPGQTTITCTALGDTDLIASCDVTVLPQSDKAKVTAASLTLDGQIGINYYLQLTDNLIDTGAKVRITHNDVATDVPITSDHVTTLNGETMYKFTYAVAAKEMNDTILLQIVDDEGNVLPLFNSKDVDVSDGYQYSVAKYCDLVKTYGNDKIKNLTKVMMNYGGYTQDYFGYGTGEGKSDDLRADIDAVTLDTMMPFKAVQSENKVSGISYYATSLLLESETTIRHYFKLEDGAEIEDYTFTCGENTLTPVAKNGQYYVEVTNIAAKDLDTAYTVTVSKGDETYSITYYPLSYGYSVLKNSNKETLLDMVKALYLYNQAANTYFGDN